VIAADWNFPWSLLQGSRWLQTVGGRPFTTGEHTCIAGEGAELDYFVADAVFATGVQSVSLVREAGTTPHSPFLLSFSGLSWGSMVTTFRKPRCFPFVSNEDLDAGLPVPAEVQWSWEAGHLPPHVPLVDAYAEFLRNMETALLEVHEVPDKQAQAYRGRAEGLVLKQVSLDTAFRSSEGARLDPAARTWRAVRYGAVDLAKAAQRLRQHKGTFADCTRAWGTPVQYRLRCHRAPRRP